MKINMIFKIIVCILVLYRRFTTVNMQLEDINSVIYSLKQSQVQRFLKTCGKWLVFATFPHCDATFFAIVTPENDPHVPNILMIVWLTPCCL